MKEITIIKEYSEKEYTVIKRNTTCEPFVACWKFDKSTNTWAAGHYFNTLEGALKYVKSL